MALKPLQRAISKMARERTRSAVGGWFAPAGEARTHL